MRAHQVAARDDAVREIAALMQAVALNGKQALAIATERDLDVAGDHRDHIAGTNFAELRDGEPRHASLYVTGDGERCRARDHSHHRHDRRRRPRTESYAAATARVSPVEPGYA